MQMWSWNNIAIDKVSNWINKQAHGADNVQMLEFENIAIIFLASIWMQTQISIFTRQNC